MEGTASLDHVDPPSPNSKQGFAGKIEGTVTDLFHQTRPDPPYPAEVRAFADQLEAVMADGTHDLAGIVAGLNARGAIAANGTEWTPEALSRYFAELANA